MPESERSRVRFAFLWPQLVVFGTLCLTSLVRVRYLSAALERDEGAYAYMARMLLEGIPPYVSGYCMNMPGVYVVYAAFLSLFGGSSEAIRLGTWLVNSASVVLLFLLVRRLFGRVAASISACTFGLLSLGQWVQGLSSNAEHFVVLCILGALLAAVPPGNGPVENWRIHISGFLAGLAILMKQVAGGLVLFILGWLLYEAWRAGDRNGRALRRRALQFGVAVANPLVAVILWFALEGELHRFWLWTVSYPVQYSAPSDAVYFLPGFSAAVLRTASASTGPWLLAGAGGFLLFGSEFSTRQRTFVLGLLAASAIVVSPGFHFRPHYFLLFIPAVSLLAGLSIEALRQKLRKRMPEARVAASLLALCAVTLGGAVYQQVDVLFLLSPPELTRRIYGFNPFLQSVRIAEFIREQTEPDEAIAIIGSEPQILFEARRRSATAYILTYILMEQGEVSLRMQREMIDQISAVDPRIFVYVHVQMSWIRNVVPRSPRLLFDWFDQLRASSLEPIAIADISSPERTVYRFGEEARSYEPKSEFWLAVYRKR